MNELKSNLLVVFKVLFSLELAPNASVNAPIGYQPLLKRFPEKRPMCYTGLVRRI